MKDKKLVKVTLVYHPHKALGEKYEVTKLVGAVTVQYEDPANRTRKKTLRVSDHIDEADATSLGDVTEVTVIPE